MSGVNMNIAEVGKTTSAMETNSGFSSSTKEIKKEDLINQFNLLKKSSNEAYENQDYDSLSKLTMSMIELYKTIISY